MPIGMWALCLSGLLVIPIYVLLHAIGISIKLDLTSWIVSRYVLVIGSVFFLSYIYFYLLRSLRDFLKNPTDYISESLVKFFDEETAIIDPVEPKGDIVWVFEEQKGLLRRNRQRYISFKSHVFERNLSNLPRMARNYARAHLNRFTFVRLVLALLASVLFVYNMAYVLVGVLAASMDATFLTPELKDDVHVWQFGKYVAAVILEASSFGLVVLQSVSPFLPGDFRGDLAESIIQALSSVLVLSTISLMFMFLRERYFVKVGEKAAEHALILTASKLNYWLIGLPLTLRPDGAHDKDTDAILSASKFIEGDRSILEKHRRSVIRLIEENLNVVSETAVSIVRNR